MPLPRTLSIFSKALHLATVRSLPDLFTTYIHVPVGIVSFLVLAWAAQLVIQQLPFLFPAPVAAMGILFFLLGLIHALAPKKYLDYALRLVSPPADFTLRHMSIFFVPNFVLIPANEILPGKQIGIVTGWFVASFIAAWVLMVLVHFGMLKLLHRSKAIPRVSTWSIYDGVSRNPSLFNASIFGLREPPQARSRRLSIISPVASRPMYSRSSSYSAARPMYSRSSSYSTPVQSNGVSSSQTLIEFPSAYRTNSKEYIPRRYISGTSDGATYVPGGNPNRNSKNLSSILLDEQRIGGNPVQNNISNNENSDNNNNSNSNTNSANNSRRNSRLLSFKDESTATVNNPDDSNDNATIIQDDDHIEEVKNDSTTETPSGPPSGQVTRVPTPIPDAPEEVDEFEAKTHHIKELQKQEQRQKEFEAQHSKEGEGQFADVEKTAQQSTSDDENKNENDMDKKIEKLASKIQKHGFDLVPYILLLIAGIPTYFAVDESNTNPHAMPAASLPLFLSINVFTYIFSTRVVPPTYRKYFHPIVVSAFLTFFIIWAFGAMKGYGLQTILHSYSTSTTYIELFRPDRWNGHAPGAGDILSSLLHAGIVSLALPMYRFRHDLRAHFLPIITTVLSMTCLSLFVWPLAARAMGLDPQDALAFLPRFVSTPLAIELANATGANQSLTVPLVVVTGIVTIIVKDHFFKLCRVDEDDFLGIGLVIGSIAGAIGTSSLNTSNPRAMAISTVTFVLLGTLLLLLIAITPITDFIKELGALEIGAASS